MARWVQNQTEQRLLGLKFIHDCYWQDIDNNYWFNDETQSDIYGPYDTLSQCVLACTEYARSL